ncbi:aspartyl/glutamyl-tRNA amidotransferase subunit A [Neisseria canis]|uniref:Aspartyl/glutamyl-tRNA amidotransferase subunit A n=1 Tax=Neisseria canis TaxID=493 RepID=A0A448D6E1_9NEIS|nr:aspartyl/glutamyl-tRNA amidotransferase subunit A [Neisseria canis]
MNPPLLTLADWHAAFESGAADPVSLLESGLSSVGEAGNRAVFIRLTETRARPAAEAAAARLRAGKRLGALDGIAVSWKDLFDQAGETTRAGSLTTADNPPAAQDAAVVSLLESVGAVSIGRTNFTEFALSGLGQNPYFGTPANVVRCRTAGAGRLVLRGGGFGSGRHRALCRGHRHLRLRAHPCRAQRPGRVQTHIRPPAAHRCGRFRPRSTASARWRTPPPTSAR